jgi:hypothetical protein
MDAEDSIPADRENSGLTPEQAELLNKLEELYRELPSARQRSLLRTLRAKREQPATEKTPE